MINCLFACVCVCVCTCVHVCVFGVWGLGTRVGRRIWLFFVKWIPKNPQQTPRRDSVDVNFQILTGFFPPCCPSWHLCPPQPVCVGSLANLFQHSQWQGSFEHSAQQICSFILAPAETNTLKNIVIIQTKKIHARWSYSLPLKVVSPINKH